MRNFTNTISDSTHNPFLKKISTNFSEPLAGLLARTTDSARSLFPSFRAAGFGVFIVLLLLMKTDISISQTDHPASALTAPESVVRSVPQQDGPAPNETQSIFSRWYGSIFAVSNNIICKSFLNTSAQSYVGGLYGNSFFGGALINGTYYGLRYIGPGTANIVSIDTNTGAQFNVSNISGLSSGNTVSGMAFDRTTGITYVSSTSGASGTLYTLNLQSGVLTVVGPMTGMTIPIEIAINRSGVMYSWDVISDRLYIVNKVNGTATGLPNSLGVDLNFAQGGGFDPDTDSLFLCVYTSSGTSGMYKCNLNTGQLTFMYSFPFFNGVPPEIDAFVMPYNAVTVSGAVNGNGIYPCLSKAIAAVNSFPQLNANIIISIINNTAETSSSDILQGTWNSMIIRPSGNAPRTITGNLASPLIGFVGADRVTIDGLNTGGHTLTIANGSTAAVSTLHFSNDATNNVITRCTVTGSSNLTGSGVITFAGGPSGSNNNSISSCAIVPATTNPLRGIYFTGLNKSDTVRDCTINNYTATGIAVVSGGSNIIISNNKFFQNGTLALTGTEHSAISINSSFGKNYIITGNTIGYSSAAGTGVYGINSGGGNTYFFPIIMNVGTDTASLIQGNTITAINLTGSFSGTGAGAPFQCININGGSVNILNNVIGTTGTPNISFNTLNPVDIFGIRITNMAASNSVSGNTIAGITIVPFGGAKTLTCIRNSVSSGNTFTCSGNTLGGNSANSVSGFGNLNGIVISGNGTSSVSQNTIKNFVSTSVVNGINTVSTGASKFLIDRNYIHSILSDAAAVVKGILLEAADTNVCTNNMISLDPNPFTTNVTGIYDAAGRNSFYYNSIYIGGSQTTGGNSYGYYSISGVFSKAKNNVFYNARSSVSGTSKHYSVWILNGTPGPSGPLFNNNDLYVSGTMGMLGSFMGSNITNLPAWISATGQDSNSISGDPKFISDADLHIDTTVYSPLRNAGVNIPGITIDFDGNTRSATTPDIGADEFNGLPGIINLDLTMLVEGFYDAGSDSQVSDTVKCYLHNSVSPYVVVDSAIGVVSSSGNLPLAFKNAGSGTYYIVIDHRNTIQTWSANAVAMTPTLINYDFITAANKAYGDNMKEVDASPVTFAVYSGDPNKDGTIDVSDLIYIYNDLIILAEGYITSDINGDSFADVSDLIITYNNSVNFIVVIRP